MWPAYRISDTSLSGDFGDFVVISTAPLSSPTSSGSVVGYTSLLTALGSFFLWNNGFLLRLYWGLSWTAQTKGK